MTRLPGSTGSPALDESLRALRNALVRLHDTEDRVIARRNGRTRALAALRKVRAVLDEAYPGITVVRERKRLKTVKGRLDRLRRAGWVDVFGDSALGMFASAGVRVRRIVIKHGEDNNGPITRTYYFVPAWAKAIGPDKPSELRAAKKSRLKQRAAVVAEALR